MSRHLRTSSIWKLVLEDSNDPTEPVADEQPSDEQPQEEESLTESEDITPDEEKEDAEAPDVEESDLEAYLQELAKLETGGARGDDPEVIGRPPANPEADEMPETGEGKPPV